MNTVVLPQARKREFLPNDYKMTVWSKLKPYYGDLLKRPINSVKDLERWIIDRSELEAMVMETFARRYIAISIDNSDQHAQDLYQYAVQKLSPRIASFENRLNQKLVHSPFLSQLDTGLYKIYLRSVKNAVTLFREKNIPLATEVQLKSKEYGKIFSEMTIGLNGKQMTLQKAGTLLEETDRNCREAVYHKINQRILQDTDHLEGLFDQLLQKRHQIARNAGFDNFRDYKFKALGRFDYQVADCLDFHESIAHEILRLVDELNRYRRDALGLSKLRPWDLNVDTSGERPLRPFEHVDELVEKTINCLTQVNPLFGKTIAIMREMGHLELESRKGKSPGGYNMPLHLTGVPFIFMNATSSLTDMRTLLHESGHAVHSFLIRDYKLTSAKRMPSEVSELAAMTMELLTMDHWDHFFPEQEQLLRAKIIQLENVLRVLPWIATVDKFQHWIYTHPEHTLRQRREKWMEIFLTYSSGYIDREGVEEYIENLWHKQLHIFEVPFYYIEYGMAQLGAIAIWKKYRENPQEAVSNYIEALKLGYTRPIKEIYRTAGISFDFSREYVSELGAFVKKELEELIGSSGGK